MVGTHSREFLYAPDRLPAVASGLLDNRQLAVDLSINLNTVSRAYTELELTGLVDTQMGSGTFMSTKKIDQDEVERQRILDEICQQLLSRATTHGLSLDDILENLKRLRSR